MVAFRNVVLSLRLVTGLLAVQGCFCLISITTLPYTSLVLNFVEVASSALDFCKLVILLATYAHVGANFKLQDDYTLQLNTATVWFSWTGLIVLGAGLLWRLLVLTAALDTMVFVVFRPAPLERLHQLLSRATVSASAGMYSMRLMRSPISQGE
jgi:hypothetical protein